MQLFQWFFLSCLFMLCRSHSIRPNPLLRGKREVTGALHIVTHDAVPIHEDVKPENTNNDSATAEPCPEKSPPSFIEMGTVFQVTAPRNLILRSTSLRKSLPLSSKLELVRSISRAFTMFVLVITAGLEFYPLLRHLYTLINSADL